MPDQRGHDVETATPGGKPSTVWSRGARALAAKGALGKAAKLLLDRPRIARGLPGAAADRELAFRESEQLLEDFGDVERRG